MSYIPRMRVWDSEEKRMLYPPLQYYNIYIENPKRYTVMMSANRWDVTTNNPRELYELDVVKVIHSEDENDPRNTENAIITWCGETSSFGYLKGGFIWDFCPYDTVSFVGNIETTYKENIKTNE